ncbi:MAG: hypothetical protein WAM42_09890 [Candidatus Nitrosopolaris sp.]
MEILQDSKLAKYLFEKYASNPKNWNFLISTIPLRDGFFDATVSNVDEVWQLKIDSIYKPVPIILGTKVDLDATKIERKISNGSPTFGYRKLESSIMMSILKKLALDQQMNANKELGINNYINSVLGSVETVAPVTGENYAYGPFVFTDRNPVNSEYQKQVAEKLALRLRDNLRNRYSSYG